MFTRAFPPFDSADNDLRPNNFDTTLGRRGASSLTTFHQGRGEQAQQKNRSYYYFMCTLILIYTGRGQVRTQKNTPKNEGPLAHSSRRTQNPVTPG